MFGGRALPRPAGGAKALLWTPLATVRGPTSKGMGEEGRKNEGNKAKGVGTVGGKGREWGLLSPYDLFALCPWSVVKLERKKLAEL